MKVIPQDSAPSRRYLVIGASYGYISGRANRQGREPVWICCSSCGKCRIAVIGGYKCVRQETCRSYIPTFNRHLRHVENGLHGLRKHVHLPRKYFWSYKASAQPRYSSIFCIFGNTRSFIQKEAQPTEPTSRVQSKAGVPAEAVSGDDTVMADATDVAVKVGSDLYHHTSCYRLYHPYTQSSSAFAA